MKTLNETLIYKSHYNRQFNMRIKFYQHPEAYEFRPKEQKWKNERIKKRFIIFLLINYGRDSLVDCLRQEEKFPKNCCQFLFKYSHIMFSIKCIFMIVNWNLPLHIIYILFFISFFRLFQWIFFLLIKNWI